MVLMLIITAAVFATKYKVQFSCAICIKPKSSFNCFRENDYVHCACTNWTMLLTSFTRNVHNSITIIVLELGVCKIGPGLIKKS